MKQLYRILAYSKLTFAIDHAVSIVEQIKNGSVEKASKLRDYLQMRCAS